MVNEKVTCSTELFCKRRLLSDPPLWHIISQHLLFWWFFFFRRGFPSLTLRALNFTNTSECYQIWTKLRFFSIGFENAQQCFSESAYIIILYVFSRVFHQFVAAERTNRKIIDNHYTQKYYGAYSRLCFHFLPVQHDEKKKCLKKRGQQLFHSRPPTIIITAHVPNTRRW